MAALRAAADAPQALSIARMVWHGAQDLAAREVIPLAVLEMPCRFREAARASLELARRPFRIAVETPNLSTLRAAVEAGIGVTCRTAPFLPAAVPVTGLPALPDVARIIAHADGLGPSKARLAGLAAGVISAL